MELQGYADQHATKLFFSWLKALYWPTSKSMTPIRAEVGTLLTDEAHILERWSAHFNQLLNKVSNVEEQAISNIRQRPIILALDGCPTVAETQKKIINQLQIGKVPGADGIPPEIYKMGGLALVEHLTGIFQSFWRKGELPQDLKDANIMHLYKNKGDKSVCDNHRGISLLIAGIMRQKSGKTPVNLVFCLVFLPRKPGVFYRESPVTRCAR